MTQDELKNSFNDVKSRMALLEKFLKVQEMRQQKQDVEQAMLAPDFWDSREKSQAAMGKLSAAKNIIDGFNKLNKEADDYLAFAELAMEEGGEEMLAEADGLWATLAATLDKTELLNFLSGKYDHNNAFLSIHAGAGGTESCDWAGMLLRMYHRWIERRGWTEELIDYQPGDEAGVKSVTLLVKGEFVYGYGKAERGVHRLVRISPFDSNARRHTSFASVELMPEVEDDPDIVIDEKDLRVDTYRSSGAGGQHVNKTDSAIRITHLPTGTMVSCQQERSQHKNRAMAMRMLTGRLAALQELERRKEAAQISGDKAEMGWGSQIRSYVLQPYQMVKDLRTDVETGNTQAVLDGDIDRFVDAWLRSQKPA